MKPLRLSAVSLAVASVLYPAMVPAASTKALEQQLHELAEKVKVLEGALAESKKAEAAKPAAPPIQELDQKVKVLERKQEIAEEDAVKNKKGKTTFKAGEQGFSFASPDGDFELKLRGYVQADSRWVFDDTRTGTATGNFTDTFLLRRVRPIFEGTVWKYYGFRIMPDFDGGTGAFSLQDAYIETKHRKEIGLRAGKFKGPVGLERLQSGADIRFTERGLPTNLVPNRDNGVQLQGDLFDGALSYAAGYFNGVADRGSSTVDTTDDKEFEGRIFALPFKSTFGPLQGLGVGIGGTYGDTNGASGLSNYVSTSQSTTSNPVPVITSAAGVVTLQTPTAPFAYAAGSIAAGLHSRIAPQGYWHWGPFGLLGEYVVSSQEVSRTSGALTNKRAIDNDAWQITASYVLTGEDNSYKSITPKKRFDPFNGSWGAWELTGRYGELDVDDDAFVGLSGTGTATARLTNQQNTRLASPLTAVTHISSWGLGVNWYLNANLRLYADYDETSFTNGGGGTEFAVNATNTIVRQVSDRETEKLFSTRLQISY